MMDASVKLLFIATILSLITFYMHQYFFPNFITKTIKQTKSLKRDSDTRKLWEKSPISLDFKVFIFNVTNPEEAAKGAKINLQQIGPFFYDEWKKKSNIKDYPAEDAVTFNMHNTLLFNAKKSRALTGDEIVYLPHVLLVSLVSTLARIKPEAMTYLNMAVPWLFDSPKTIFVPTRVRDFLFDGMRVNCNETDFSQAIFCSEFRNNPRGLVKLDDETFLFSVFGAKNGTPEEILFKVNRGVKDSRLTGEVMEYNRSRTQTVWPGEKCNEIRGSDSTIFPSFIDKNGFTVFAADFCRTLTTTFVEEVDHKGIPTYKFTADLGDPRESEDRCFCTTKDTCLKRNTFDLTLCSGAPLAISFPHFYDSDPEYINAVVGLNPRKEKHEVSFLIEPMTGTPVVAYRRLQFNLILAKHPEMEIMEGLSEKPLLLPLFWIEEGVELGDNYLDQLRGLMGIFSKITILASVMAAIAGGLVAFALYIKFGRARVSDKKDSSVK